MLQSSNISFAESKALNPLVFDYIDRKKELQQFYSCFPDKNGFSEILKSNLYSDFKRDKLVKILSKQSSLVKNTTDASQKHIELLKNKNTYTVTTGHQLCLFTGPLYFIYKLFSVINLAEDLKKDFPQFDFVPVYWMASEDHDFEEINHFNVFGKKIKWETEQKGAVGKFKTEELKETLNSFREIAGPSENTKQLTELFEKAYLSHNNLKDATRYLINELFGMYGLVIADGDDEKFKGLAKELFVKDIFENISYRMVTASINQLSELKYKNQVNPREINCFYLDSNFRGRIERKGENYIVGNKEMSGHELKELISNSPEKISPNVVLRPIYQQYILPNIAYVGGPGELAYWLQYKLMFDDYKIQFPILVPRSFITVIDKNSLSKIERLGLEPKDFFKDEQQIVKAYLLKIDQNFELSEEKLRISESYNLIKEKIERIDITLLTSVLAEEQKSLNSIDLIAQKANRALKQKSEIQLNQIKQIKQKLFPEKIPQERFENYASFYINWGDDFLTFIKQNIHPLSLKHYLISEK